MKMLNWVWQMGQKVTSASGCHRGRTRSEGLLDSCGLCCGWVALVAAKAFEDVLLREAGGGDGGVAGRLEKDGDPGPADRWDEMLEPDADCGSVGSARSAF